MTPQDSIIHLQQTIGNQAVQRLMRYNARNDSRKNGIQTKLKISQPGDMYEQEADRIAEHVMRMSAPSQSNPTVTKDEKRIDRKCAACEMKKEEEEEKMTVRRKSSTASKTEVTSDVNNEISNMRSSGGFSLDASTRGFLEPRFGGHNFSNVRIHTDERAVRSANSVKALAYTLGNDIAFGDGQYQPNRLEGKRLLAHELTHVIQHSGIKGRVSSPNADIVSRQPNPDPRVDDAAKLNPIDRDSQYRAELMKPKPDYEHAALLLNGFNDKEIKSYVTELNGYDLYYMRQGALKKMPGWHGRVTSPINERMKETIEILLAAGEPKDDVLKLIVKFFDMPNKNAVSEILYKEDYDVFVLTLPNPEGCVDADACTHGPEAGKFKIFVSPRALKNVPYLISAIRHEYEHVAQRREDVIPPPTVREFRAHKLIAMDLTLPSLNFEDFVINAHTALNKYWRSGKMKNEDYWCEFVELRNRVRERFKLATPGETKMIKEKSKYGVLADYEREPYPILRPPGPCPLTK